MPITQTSSAVTLSEVLSVLQSDIRSDLRTLLHEFGTEALAKGGAKGLNRAIPYFEPAYRLTALTNDALLGEQPKRDLRRVLRGQTRVAGALADNPAALRDLVVDLNTTAGAVASAGRRAGGVGARAARRAAGRLPGARRARRRAADAARVLDRGAPGRALYGADPRRRDPLDRAGPRAGAGGRAQGAGRRPAAGRAEPGQAQQAPEPALRQLRALSSCTNSVLVPFAESGIPSVEAGNSGQAVRIQIMRSFVGLSGESRNNDANTPVFHIQGVSPLNLSAGRIEPAAPHDPNTPPVHRPDVACETQAAPNLNGPQRLRARHAVHPGDAVRLAIRKHFRSFLAVIGLIVVGLAIAVYILERAGPALPADREVAEADRDRARERPGGAARAGTDRSGRRGRGGADLRGRRWKRRRRGEGRPRARTTTT